MRIVVAGGAGFIGGHLCRRLVRRGDSVACIDDLSTGSYEAIASLRSNPLFRFVNADVTGLNYRGWEYPNGSHYPGEPVDVVVHLASSASPVAYTARPVETLLANSLGTLRLLERALEHRARFVYASTSEVYGDPLEHPQRESYYGNVSSVGPRSMYDEGKRFGEALVTAYRRHVSGAIVRIFNTYGPGMRLDDGRVVTEFISAALRGEPLPVHGDGLQTRSLMYVDDLVDALVKVIDDPDSDGLVANVGNPAEKTVLAIARRVLALTDSSSPIAYLQARQDDPKQRCPDVAVFCRRYEWTPRVTLDDGLMRTIAWAREELAA